MPPPSPLNDLRDKIDATRGKKKDGGFSGAPRPNLAIKERRALRGHFGKGTCLYIYKFSSRLPCFQVLLFQGCCCTHTHPPHLIQ
jgi:hypothetical protein